MKLKVQPRKTDKKSIICRIRYDGDIPAIVYGYGKESESLTVKGPEFSAILRSIEKGHLPTTVFELEGEKAKRKVICKEIQYHKTTYNILHLDFQELQKECEISVNVPIHFSGVAECEGIKLGGFLRQVKSHVRVKCLPKDMPLSFVVDVRKLGIKQTKRVKDIAMPKGVKPMIAHEEVIMVIAK